MPTAQLSALDPISSWSAIAFSAVLIAVVLTPIRNRPMQEVTRTAVGLSPLLGDRRPASAGMRMRHVHQRRSEDTLDLAHRHGIYLRPAVGSTASGISGLELARDEVHLERAALADELDLDARAYPLGHHQPLKVADVRHRLAVHGDDQVLGAQAGPGGRAAIDHLDDLDALSRPDRAAIAGGSGREPPTIPM